MEGYECRVGYPKHIFIFSTITYIHYIHISIILVVQYRKDQNIQFVNCEIAGLEIGGKYNFTNGFDAQKLNLFKFLVYNFG